jgi:hypothetical protein
MKEIYDENTIFGTHGDHFRDIQRRINVYEAAIRGEYDVHYWTDANGILYATRYTLPGAHMEPTLDTLEPQQMKELGIDHAGIMSTDKLRQNIANLIEGNSEGAIAEAG